MQLHDLDMTGGNIVIEFNDKITNSKFKGTTFVLRYPTVFILNVISWVSPNLLHYKDVNLKQPHAVVTTSILNDCKFEGEAMYQDNHIKEVQKVVEATS